MCEVSRVCLIIPKLYIGVPESTILRPLLWYIFNNDLSPATSHVKYADDATLYHSIYMYKNSAMVAVSTANLQRSATVDRSVLGSYHLCCRLEQRQSDASQYHKVIIHLIHPQEVNICRGQYIISL